MANPLDGGTISGGGEFSMGTTVSAQAFPRAGYAFINWAENGLPVSSANPHTFTATTNRTLRANFKLVSGIGNLRSGETIQGTLARNESHTFEFHALAGAGIVVAMGDPARRSGFDPRITLYSPDGLPLKEAWGFEGARLHATATEGGLHRLVIDDYNQEVAGDYLLSLAVAPAAQVGPPGRP